MPEKVWDSIAFEIIGGILLALYLQQALEHIQPLSSLGESVFKTNLLVVWMCFFTVYFCKALPSELRKTSPKGFVGTAIAIGVAIAMNDYIATAGQLPETALYELRFGEAIFVLDGLGECFRWVMILRRKIRERQ